jgi:hypothetical protein
MAGNPHWYVVVAKAHDHRVDALLALLWRYSVPRRWFGGIYYPVRLDGWDYWLMEPGIVNRKPSAFAGWDGDPRPPKGWLPEHLQRDMRGDEELDL